MSIGIYINGRLPIVDTLSALKNEQAAGMMFPVKCHTGAYQLLV